MKDYFDRRTPVQIHGNRGIKVFKKIETDDFSIEYGINRRNQLSIDLSRLKEGVDIAQIIPKDVKCVFFIYCEALEMPKFPDTVEVLFFQHCEFKKFYFPKNLKELYFDYLNNIKLLPDLCNLKNLWSLHLGGQRHSLTLPEKLPNNITFLTLGPDPFLKSSLKHLPLSLEALYIDECPLIKIVPDLRYLKKLRFITMNYWFKTSFKVSKTIKEIKGLQIDISGGGVRHEFHSENRPGFQSKILFQTEEFGDNKGETFDRYKGDDYEVFFNMYQGKKYMNIYVFTRLPKIPDDVYYLNIGYDNNNAKFPKIPASVKYIFMDGHPFKELPKIPDTVVDLSISLRKEKCLLKNTGDLSYLTNLKKFAVTYRGNHLEIGKLPESLRTFSAVGIDGTLVLPEKFPKNLFFIHLHGFDKMVIPDLTYLKKLRILSVFVCDVINYFKTPPVLACELRFLSMKKNSKPLPSNYKKDRELVSFTYSTYF